MASQNCGVEKVHTLRGGNEKITFCSIWSHYVSHLHDPCFSLKTWSRLSCTSLLYDSISWCFILLPRTSLRTDALTSPSTNHILSQKTTAFNPMTHITLFFLFLLSRPIHNAVSGYCICHAWSIYRLPSPGQNLSEAKICKLVCYSKFTSKHCTFLQWHLFVG